MKQIKNFKPLRKTDKQKYEQGYFDKFNPVKYYGNRPIIYRSSWELKFMRICELNPSVKSWTSENIAIPYILKEPDKKTGKPILKRHTYYPDFIVETHAGKRYLIEVKPENQTPQSISQIKHSFIHYKNAIKWKAAIEWCKYNNMEFKVVTEQHLKTKIFV